jgi:hypothetical protein
MGVRPTSYADCLLLGERYWAILLAAAFPGGSLPQRGRAIPQFVAAAVKGKLPRGQTGTNTGFALSLVRGRPELVSISAFALAKAARLASSRVAKMLLP